jgi:hypothetical protein
MDKLHLMRFCDPTAAAATDTNVSEPADVGDKAVEA